MTDSHGTVDPCLPELSEPSGRLRPPRRELLKDLVRQVVIDTSEELCENGEYYGAPRRRFPDHAVNHQCAV
ncbi:hypothetical protein [Mycolicibacterium gadium]|uniref:Transposase n=1 Tax=Mycolicibacterium gadium TaxID=1794 RepID=A0ABT6GU53_MYCGU|nr:hypothetical protein [Mycolicibacterium gadium]MDG5484831.1 hypothetical protein [Mycolicibacterium gadium]